MEIDGLLLALVAVGVIAVLGVLLFVVILALLRRLGSGGLVGRAFASFLFVAIMYALLGWAGLLIAMVAIIFANMK
jgi:hypothetical protein